MKTNKISAILHHVCAILFYLAAIFHFAGDGKPATGVIWLVLGSLYLCLGSIYAKRAKKENEEKT